MIFILVFIFIIGNGFIKVFVLGFFRRVEFMIIIVGFVFDCIFVWLVVVGLMYVLLVE